MFATKTSVKTIFNSVKDLQPEQFLNTNVDVSSRSLLTLKRLYDYTKDEETQSGLSKNHPLTSSTSRPKKKRKVGLSLTEAPLTELITESFDSEQIWEEVQLQNGLIYESLVTSISKLLAHSNSLQSQAVETKEENALYRNHISKTQSFDSDEDEEGSEIEFEGDRKLKKQKRNAPLIYSKSVVDDKFFNLAQMTEFLEKVECQIESKNLDNQVDASDSEDSIDLFDAMDESGDEDSQEETGENIYYDAYFDRPIDEVCKEKNEEGKINSEGEDDGEDVNAFDEESVEESGTDENSASQEKSRTLNLELDEASSSSSEDEELSQPKVISEEIPDTNLSTFEKRRRKLEENIKLMEEAALHPKGWQFQGEITAERRPENSLLDENLLFDHLLRQAPEITATTTLKLEDIIQQRIKDLAWDDVERKAKPVNTLSEYKNTLVLDSEKSKQSLAQIYEQEFINKKKAEDGQNDDESVPEEEAKIQKDMRTLFAKLDALSNFHFTPKPPSAEIKIVTNLPSIAMEEVAPVSVSDANLLAPQEIQAPIKGEIKSAAERTSTDQKRERRVKKKKQHLKRVDREERARLKGLGLRNVKLADNIISRNKSKDNALENVHNTKELKSSKAFFRKLQDTVQTQIQEKIAKTKKSDSKKSPQAKRFKL